MGPGHFLALVSCLVAGPTLLLWLAGCSSAGWSSEKPSAWVGLTQCERGREGPDLAQGGAGQLVQVSVTRQEE